MEVPLNTLHPRQGYADGCVSLDLLDFESEGGGGGYWRGTLVWHCDPGDGDLLRGGGSLELGHLFAEIRYVKASRLTSLVSVNRHKRSNKVCHKKDGFDQKERKHLRAKRASMGDPFGVW